MMLPVLTLLPLAFSVTVGVGTIEDECVKTDGVQPTRCEQALATELFDYQQALQGCAVMHEAEKDKNAKLVDLMLNQPVPEAPSSFSLFGLPDWATGILVGTVVAAAVGGGVAIGVGL